MNLPDPESFNFKDGVVGGDDCWLIIPKAINCVWNEDNLQFRSMIIRKSDHKIISRGYDKFFNWSEAPELDKFPDGPFESITKLDGSLIIWGTHNKELIHRTRGTFDASFLPNGSEIEFLKNKYSQFVDAVRLNPTKSILTEWQTKSNIIVIDEVEEPTLSLIGIIDNETGLLTSQKRLDELALDWELNRPTRHHYDSIQELISDVNSWVDSEGVVVYSQDGQSLRKIKSEWYRSLHAMAEGYKNINNVLDVFLESPKFLDPKQFFEYLEQYTSHEVAVKCKDHIEKICLSYEKFINKITFIRSQIDIFIRTMSSRKEQAIEINQKFGKGWKSTYAFLYLDNKEIPTALLKKALVDNLPQ